MVISTSAFSENSEALHLCTVQSDKHLFKADCRHETLQQLHLAFKEAGLVDLHFPHELAEAPVSVTVDRVSLDRLLQTALSSYC
jgi:hypothetical protein